VTKANTYGTQQAGASTELAVVRSVAVVGYAHSIKGSGRHSEAAL